MTENTSRTAMLAPTVGLVRDLGSGRRSSPVSQVLADVSTTMTCLYLRALERPAAGCVGFA